MVFLALWRPPPAVRSRASTVSGERTRLRVVNRGVVRARRSGVGATLGVSLALGRLAFLGRALPCLSRRRPGRKSCEPPRRPAAVLGSREASGLGEQDPDGIVWDTQKYTWRVGGPNDIPCVHLRDVYRGEKPLTPIPSPFCTKSSCPVTIGDRTPLNLNRVFVSEDDRVLLKSMAFGYENSDREKRPIARSNAPSPGRIPAIVVALFLLFSTLSSAFGSLFD